MRISSIRTYKGVIYPIFHMYFQKYKSWYEVGTDSLAEAISPDGTFDDADGEGQYIDQQLFFYIPDEMIADTTSQVMKYINSQT